MDAFLEAARKKAKLGIRKKAKLDVGKEGTRKKKAPKKIRVAAPEALVPGTIYIGHLPHGFYEDELKKYFSQFGNILKMRVARSRKTGNCKGYAFIQFEVEEVAKIAAETMNNYMFFEKLLKCEFVPSEKVNSNTFRGWKKHMLFSHIKNKRKQNSKKSQKVIEKNTKRRIQRLQKLKATLKDKGVLFKFKPATLKPENV